MKTFTSGGTLCSSKVKALDKVDDSHSLHVGLVRPSCESAGQEVPFAICMACGYCTTSKVVGLGRVRSRDTSGRRGRLDRVAGGLHPGKSVRMS